VGFHFGNNMASQDAPQWRSQKKQTGDEKKAARVCIADAHDTFEERPSHHLLLPFCVRPEVVAVVEWERPLFPLRQFVKKAVAHLVEWFVSAGMTVCLLVKTRVEEGEGT
jgi:hypothetical protein